MLLPCPQNFSLVTTVSYNIFNHLQYKIPTRTQIIICKDNSGRNYSFRALRIRLHASAIGFLPRRRWKYVFLRHLIFQVQNRLCPTLPTPSLSYNIFSFFQKNATLKLGLCPTAAEMAVRLSVSSAKKALLSYFRSLIYAIQSWHNDWEFNRRKRK